MLAKAGEADRHIRTKMVRCHSFSLPDHILMHYYSPNICSVEREKEERRQDDRWGSSLGHIRGLPLLSSLLIPFIPFAVVLLVVSRYS